MGSGALSVCRGGERRARRPLLDVLLVGGTAHATARTYLTKLATNTTLQVPPTILATLARRRQLTYCLPLAMR